VGKIDPYAFQVKVKLGKALLVTLFLVLGMGTYDNFQEITTADLSD